MKMLWLLLFLMPVCGICQNSRLECYAYSSQPNGILPKFDTVHIPVNLLGKNVTYMAPGEVMARFYRCVSSASELHYPSGGRTVSWSAVDLNGDVFEIYLHYRPTGDVLEIAGDKTLTLMKVHQLPGSKSGS